jgi:hypothetical protein
LINIGLMHSRPFDPVVAGETVLLAVIRILMGVVEGIEAHGPTLGALIKLTRLWTLRHVAAEAVNWLNHCRGIESLGAGDSSGTHIRDSPTGPRSEYHGLLRSFMAPQKSTFSVP